MLGTIGKAVVLCKENGGVRAQETDQTEKVTTG